MPAFSFICILVYQGMNKFLPSLVWDTLASTPYPWCTTVPELWVRINRSPYTACQVIWWKTRNITNTTEDGGYLSAHPGLLKLKGERPRSLCFNETSKISNAHRVKNHNSIVKPPLCELLSSVKGSYYLRNVCVCYAVDQPKLHTY